MVVRTDHGRELWRKSSRSSDTSCVEVARGDGLLLVRDSKGPETQILAMAPEDWRRLLERIRQGDLDRVE